MKILYLIIFLASSETCKAANILAILPVPGKSHFNMFERFLKELAARGHVVDVVSHFPLNKPFARYNDLSIKGTLPISTNNRTIKSIRSPNKYIHIKDLFAYAGPRICQAILNSTTARNLKNSSKKYDLLIDHHFGTNCMLGFAHLYKIPSIVLTTCVNLPWTSPLIGLPDNPSYIPNYYTSYLPTMTFMERLENTLCHILSKIGFDLFSDLESNIIAKRFFGSELPSLDSLARNISMVLSNSHFTIHQSRPVVPNFVEIAGIHIDEHTTLSTYFEQSLKTGTKGIIYLSFGSMLLSESLPEIKLQALFQSFKKMPYKILWKADEEKFPKHLEIPDNIQFEPWMPQLGILCHPNVKLFVSHGGLLGTLEALYCGVPVLGIPIFADQMLNIRNSASKGLAIEVPYDDISEESIMSALTLLLDDPTYKANAISVSKLFKDRPNSALETAIYWTEYVIRHNGAPHLRSVAADMPWYQYYLIDVIGAFIGFGLVILFSLYSLLMFVYVKFMIMFKQKRKIKSE